MPQPKKLSGAVFDIKPVTHGGSIDAQKIEQVKPIINLAISHAPRRIKKKSVSPSPILEAPESAAPEPILDRLPAESAGPQEDFESLVNNDLDLDVELARVGGTIISTFGARPRVRAIKQDTYQPAAHNLNDIVSEIHRSSRSVHRTPAAAPEPIFEPQAPLPLQEEAAEVPGPDLAIQLAADIKAAVVPPTISEPVLAQARPFVRRPIVRARRRIRLRRLLIGACILGALGLLAWYGIRAKRQVLQESASAVENLQSAQDSLKGLNFSDATMNFASAYESFSKAGDSLNFMGAALTGIIADLPGAGTVKSAKNLVKVGQLLSDAGAAMTQAMDAIAKTGALFNPTAAGASMADIASTFSKALAISKQDLVTSVSLLADIDASIIPADKQAAFEEFKDNLPLFQESLNQASDYARFFQNMVDQNATHRYLVLFENSSELRPAGGFPGTYGVITFKNGKLDNFLVDDVYNLDGQLKESIIPPLQMQHITPNWGMRDANWFVDFPTSARKVEEFYKKESGESVDGVIVMNPNLMARILAIVGPVSMPQYGLTLTGDNVLVKLQDEVEYGRNRTQPKQVIKDFAPILLQKIYSASSDQWMQIFNTLVAGMDQREILMYFNNLNLESFVTDKGFGGQVRQTDGDFLMPVITNIKGSKTDTVTETRFAVDTAFEGAAAVHTLTITRTHNGGATDYGFYNKQNPAYVRVLVPENAELVSIEGNDTPNYKPLIDYTANKQFVRDEDLTKLETSGTTMPNGVTTYREAGKNEFGFWLITDPGKTKSVTITYKVPKALADKTYNLYVQKQPGLVVKDFTFALTSPAGLSASASYPTLANSGGEYTYSASLTIDLPIKVQFQ